MNGTFFIIIFREKAVKTIANHGNTTENTVKNAKITKTTQKFRLRRAISIEITTKAYILYCFEPNKSARRAEFFFGGVFLKNFKTRKKTLDSLWALVGKS